jgi:hypothetical protein
LQLRAFETIEHSAPFDALANCHTSPPTPGRLSVSTTSFATPAVAELLTTIVKLVCEPTVNVPLSGVFRTVRLGGAQTEFESTNTPEITALFSPAPEHSPMESGSILRLLDEHLPEIDQQLAGHE